MVAGRNVLGFECLAHVYSLQEQVRGTKCVQVREALRSDEADLELLELFFYLSGHHNHLVGVFRAAILVQLDLLVAWALNRDAHLQVARHFREVFALWVKQSDPLVLDGVLLFEINFCDVKFVHADKFVLKDTLVLDAD